MDNDDLPRGRLLTRREVLSLVGATGFVVLARSLSSGASFLGRPSSASFLGAPSSAELAGAVAGSTGTCVVRPEQTEGPYFVDEMLNRSDIRSDPSDGTVRPGALLRLTFNVSSLAAAVCAPLAGVLVDVWHCDALGTYSDVGSSAGKKFLRGYQVTDAGGVASFTTVYPGWYTGRAVHVHFKIRSPASTNPGFEFTSQLYFDDTVTDQVHAQQPYAARGQRNTRNAQDGIYAQGGSQLLLAVAQDAQGYASTFDVALENIVGVEPGSWSGAKQRYRA